MDELNIKSNKYVKIIKNFIKFTDEVQENSEQIDQILG